MREVFSPLDAKVDDRIGLVSPQQHAAMLGGQLDVTLAVLIAEAPREGVLAGLTGAEENSLPLIPARERVLGVPVPQAPSSGLTLRTTKTTAKDVRPHAQACPAARPRSSWTRVCGSSTWASECSIGPTRPTVERRPRTARCCSSRPA